MLPANYRPLLLMIHGVNSTLEWSATVLKVLEPHFRCQPVRYRYFHTLWGPVKVYIWPVALLLLGAYSVLSVPHVLSWLRGQPDTSWKWTSNLVGANGGNAKALWILVVLLAFETLVVIKAEIQWMKKVEKEKPLWLPPLLFGLTGMVGALIGKHPGQWAFPVAALTGVALFLDLREYGTKSFSWYTLFSLPFVVMLFVSWLVYDLFTRQSFTCSFWIMLGVATLGIMEPFLRGNLAFARVRQKMQRAQNQYPLPPFVIAHSLGTYLTGHVLLETLQLRLGRILFTGCVLEQRYPWERLVPPQRWGLIAVTNYVGWLDMVAFATGCLRELWVFLTRPFWYGRFADFLGRLTTWRPLGMAGFSGFTQQKFIVHTQAPAGYCAACKKEGRRGFVHNIDHGWARHSTLNQDKSFQSWAWLPCLWGMSPHEFDEWLAWCRLGSLYAKPALDVVGQPLHSYRPQDPDGLRRCEAKLMQILWCWPIAVELEISDEGRTLHKYVAEILKTIPVDGEPVTVAQVVKRLPRYVFETVDQAFDESIKTENQDLEKLERLHPQAALKHAVLLAQNEEIEIRSRRRD